MYRQRNRQMNLLTNLPTIVLGFIFLPYILHRAALSLCGPQDLKKKYGAQWALVTGASSGIGKSIARKLASQGLNVVLVALQDSLLNDTAAELSAAYPKLTMRKVGVDLGRPGYLEQVQKQTADLKIQVVFCNAGYMLTGFFDSMPLDAQLANLECNSVSAVQITHHFLAEMKRNKLRGCFVYTSSAAAAIVSPFTVLYAATKSFISSFGASLAAEVKDLGIDVLVFHPSPVATRFYDKAHKLDMLDMFKKFAVNPDELPDVVFAAIGRTVWQDIGATAVSFRLMMKVTDYNFLSTLLSFIGQKFPDFKKQRASAN